MSGISRPVSSEWREREIVIGPDGKSSSDVEWHAPNSWDIVEDSRPSTVNYIPPMTVPPPAVLSNSNAKPDARDIDPTTFGVPRYRSLFALRRLTSQRSRPTSSMSHITGMSGFPRSSIGGESMFCTCDLDDIQEQYDTEGQSSIRTDRPESTGSSIHLDIEESRVQRCRVCLRRSTRPYSKAILSPALPVSGASTPNRSNRKSRRPRRTETLNTARKGRTVVAGRLYQDEV